MATNRTRRELPAIWAQSAADIPGSPVIGTTYGNSAIADATVQAGWPFNTVVESSTANEILRRITTLLSQLEDQGVLSWSSAITYAEGAFVMGDDGEVYRSMQGANLNKEPTVEVTYWQKVLIEDDYFHCVDQKTTGVDGGTFTGGAWRTRTLNTVKTSSSWASLSNNQITLSAGTYRASISAPAGLVDIHQARFRNITDSVTTLTGTSENTSGTVQTDYINTRSFIYGQFSITASKTFEVQHRSLHSYATSGLGNASNWEEVETYTVVEIWRIR